MVRNRWSLLWGSQLRSYEFAQQQQMCATTDMRNQGCVQPRSSAAMFLFNQRQYSILCILIYIYICSIYENTKYKNIQKIQNIHIYSVKPPENKSRAAVRSTAFRNAFFREAFRKAAWRQKPGKMLPRVLNTSGDIFAKGFVEGFAKKAPQWPLGGALSLRAPKKKKWGPLREVRQGKKKNLRGVKHRKKKTF